MLQELIDIYDKNIDTVFSDVCPLDKIFLVKKDIGIFAVRQGLTCLPADKPNMLRLGWIVYEVIGLAITQTEFVKILNFF